MVRERKATRPKRSLSQRRGKKTPTPEAKPGSIWDTPHMKKILSQPVGTPMELTREEMDAIFRDMIENPRPYDAKKADKAIRELRKIRRESGALLVRHHADD